MRTLLATAFLVSCAQVGLADALTVDKESTVSVELSPGLTAEIARHDERVAAIGPNGLRINYEDMFPFNDIAGPTALIEDINGNGIKDVLLATGIGYGGVNIFYSLLIWQNDTWIEIADISNPEFFPERQSFTTSMRSGPFWTSELWEVGASGVPSRTISQTAIFGGFDVRRTYSGDGEFLAEILVADSTGLFGDSTVVQGIVGSEGASFQSPDPDGMAIALWLEPGTKVTLLEWDNPSGLVLIETSAGIKGWIDPQTIEIE